MDIAACREFVERALIDVPADDRADPVEVVADARPHACVPGAWALVTCESAPSDDAAAPQGLRIYHGSLEKIAAGKPDLDAESLIRSALEHALTHNSETCALHAAEADEENLFRAHAAFIADKEVANGWYRMGDELAPDLWAVDLDLFLEVTLRRDEWSALTGRRLRLAILDEEIEVEVPLETDLGEIWTLEGAGLFEPEPGLTEEDLESLPAEEVRGTCGNLHVVPFVL